MRNGYSDLFVNFLLLVFFVLFLFFYSSFTGALKKKSEGMRLTLQSETEYKISV